MKAKQFFLGALMFSSTVWGADVKDSIFFK